MSHGDRQTSQDNRRHGHGETAMAAGMASGALGVAALAGANAMGGLFSGVKESFYALKDKFDKIVADWSPADQATVAQCGEGLAGNVTAFEDFGQGTQQIAQVQEQAVAMNAGLPNLAEKSAGMALA